MGNGKVWWDYVKGVKDSGVLGTDHPRPMGVVFDHSKHMKFGRGYGAELGVLADCAVLLG